MKPAHLTRTVLARCLPVLALVLLFFQPIALAFTLLADLTDEYGSDLMLGVDSKAGQKLAYVGITQGKDSGIAGFKREDWNKFVAAWNKAKILPAGNIGEVPATAGSAIDIGVAAGGRVNFNLNGKSDMVMFFLDKKQFAAFDQKVKAASNFLSK